jgi:formate hydrogenlyase subunit 4
MNGVLATILAALVYPGLLVALLAALLLSWGRASVRAAVSRAPVPDPLGEAREVRGALERDTIIPDTLGGWVTGFASTAALLLPLVALVLLPVPGNPLVSSLGLTGDLAAEGGLLLGVPLLRLFVGWAVPSPYTRLTADRDARLLAGALLPLVLGLTAIAEEVATTQLTGDAARSPLQPIAFVARLLAALAVACALPVLARVTALGSGGAGTETPGGELGELSGADLARFRLAETLQLAAVAAVFTAAFVLPLFPTVTDGGRYALWVVGIVVVALGLGAWDAISARRAPIAEERPPLSWWVGWPALVGLIALVAAAWATRGS